VGRERDDSKEGTRTKGIIRKLGQGLKVDQTPVGKAMLGRKLRAKKKTREKLERLKARNLGAGRLAKKKASFGMNTMSHEEQRTLSPEGGGAGPESGRAGYHQNRGGGT